MCMCVLSRCDPMDYSPPGFSIKGIFQERILNGVPFPPPRDLPDPGIKPESPAFAGGFFTTEPPGKPPSKFLGRHKFCESCSEYFCEITIGSCA